MSNAEILAQLPRLKAEERRQIYRRLCELQDQDLLNGTGPSEEEKKLLARTLRKREKQLADLQGDEQLPVELPPGLKGKIVQVDPKYQFVVLNIGGNQGVLENGEMLINRQGRLVGKVRILNVEPDRSVANIVQAWKQAEPFEGDEVLY